jgi:hypothetical protein
MEPILFVFFIVIQVCQPDDVFCPWAGLPEGELTLSLNILASASGLGPSGSPWFVGDIHSSSPLPDDSRHFDFALVPPWSEGVPRALVPILSDCLCLCLD